MSWFTQKAVGDLAEKAMCRWFTRCGWEALRHEGHADFDLTVQASIEVKHDLRAAATGYVAIELAGGSGRSGLMTSRAAYWAHVVGDEAILMRTEVLRRAISEGPWPASAAATRWPWCPSRRSSEWKGRRWLATRKSGVRSQESEGRSPIPAFCLLTPVS